LAIFAATHLTKEQNPERLQLLVDFSDKQIESALFEVHHGFLEHRSIGIAICHNHILGPRTSKTTKKTNQKEIDKGLSMGLLQAKRA